jgi:hypothetical protein
VGATGQPPPAALVGQKVGRWERPTPGQRTADAAVLVRSRTKVNSPPVIGRGAQDLCRSAGSEARTPRGSGGWAGFVPLSRRRGVVEVCAAGERGRPVRRTGRSGARGGSDGAGRVPTARGGSDGAGRFRRRGAVPTARGGSRRRGAVPTARGGSDGAGRFRRTKWSPEDQISDRFGCKTTHSRARKTRLGCSTAGGWGTTQSTKTRRRVGRFPGGLRSRDDFRVNVTPWCRARREDLGHAHLASRDGGG